MSKRPISLGGPDRLAKRTEVPTTPESPTPPEPTMLEASKIAAIRTVIYRIAEHEPLNLSAVMRAIDRGIHSFGNYFSPESKRVPSDTLDALIALFECTTAEEFFALDPRIHPHLKELISLKRLGQYHGRLRRNDTGAL